MRLRPHLTYANVMSSVGVFIALSGTSYAAVKLSAKSVGERELKDSAVTSSKIQDGTIAAADLAAAALTAGPRGPRGGEGPAGAKGDGGPAGPRGPSDAYVATGAGGFPTQANVRMTAAKITGLPAGSYVFTASAHIANWQNPGAVGYCAIRVNGDDVDAGLAVIGNSAGSTRIAHVAPTGWATVSANATAALECWVDQAIPADASVGSARLAAIRVETLKR